MSNKYYSEFDALKVNATIDWDFDDGEECPDSEIEYVFSADELDNVAHCLNRDELDWIFDEEVFEQWFSDYITDQEGFCHNGFSYYYSPIKKKN